MGLRKRPSGRVVMRQRWRDLLFLHFPCAPEEIAPYLPTGLSVDTFPDETGVDRAWVGLVPFLMKDVRWAFAPKVPGTHTFPETNVRTYVQRGGEAPGVWFLSLDAANALAVRIAQIAFSLPYFHASMRASHENEQVSYESERAEASCSIEARLGPKIATPLPGTLEFFLIERYLLYSARGDRLWSGRVFHQPYALREARVERIDEGLVRAAGIAPKPFVHTLFSDGVDVEIFPLQRLR